jgi:CRISPR-associated protein Cmr5
MTINPANTRRTLEQRRANHAWEAIQVVLKEYPPSNVNNKKSADSRAKKYGSQAKKLPMRIIAAGLGQALAFLVAKDYAPDLLVALSDWVLEKHGKPDDRTGPPTAKQVPTLKDRLLKSIVQDECDLRWATEESLAYLVWLTRFAEANGLADAEEN